MGCVLVHEAELCNIMHNHIWCVTPLQIMPNYVERQPQGDGATFNLKQILLFVSEVAPSDHYL